MEWNILGSWNQQQQGLTVAWFVAVTFFKQLWKWWLFSKTVKMMARFEREWRNHSPAFVCWLQMQGGGTNAGEWWRDCLAIISFRAIMKFQFFKIWSVIHKTFFFKLHRTYVHLGLIFFNQSLFMSSKVQKHFWIHHWKICCRLKFKILNSIVWCTLSYFWWQRKHQQFENLNFFDLTMATMKVLKNFERTLLTRHAMRREWECFL